MSLLTVVPCFLPGVAVEGHDSDVDQGEHVVWPNLRHIEGEVVLVSILDRHDLLHSRAQGHHGFVKHIQVSEWRVVDLNTHAPAWELATINGHPEVALAVVRVETTTANAFAIAQEILALPPEQSPTGNSASGLR